MQSKLILKCPMEDENQISQVSREMEVDMVAPIAGEAPAVAVPATMCNKCSGQVQDVLSRGFFGCTRGIL